MPALSGIRVLELSHYIAGPFCGQLLADHGADVIKVEPLAGEPGRHASPRATGDQTLYFPSLNRRKRSLSVDLTHHDGRAILQRLASESDVLVTNYGPRVPAKIGFDYETLANLNRRIVMLHLTGFGLSGEWRDRIAFDGAVQALSGLAHLTGEPDGPPIKTGVYIADHVAGLQGALGVLLALQARQTTGSGQQVDVAMLDSMMSMLAYEFARISHAEETPRRNGNRSANVFATTFPTADGHVYIAPLSDAMWQRFSQVIGRPDLSTETAATSTADVG